MRSINEKRGDKFKAVSISLTTALLAACTTLSGCSGDGTGATAETDSIPAVQQQMQQDTALSAITEPSSEDDKDIYNYAITNRLTGLPMTDAELHNQRPVAIMINNIKAACPQVGLRNADVIYECTVEGGITRLMMLTTDYKMLGTVGSVRSCREYYLDFAANHDAIYVHIGGSDAAYENIYNRNIDDLDGLRMNIHFRDQERMKTMAYEHTAMTNGDLLISGIETKGYRTEIDTDANTSFAFLPYTDKQSATEGGNSATNVKIPYTGVHQPRYEYDTETEKYFRFQFIEEKHIDGETGEQISFDNVLVIECPHSNRGDALHHIDVYTTGSGKGYYISKGKYIPITWEKSGVDAPMTLKDENGKELQMNCGTTFVNIVSDVTFDAITME